MRDNVVHDVPYHGISADSCFSDANIVERNALWALGLNGIHAAGFAVVRNNVVLGAAVNGIHVWDPSGLTSGVDVVHNTVLFTGLECAITLNGVDEVRVAGNALYAPGREAIRVVDGADGTVVGNVGSGSFDLGGPGFACCGAVALDFVAADLSGAPPNDPFPAPGSTLLGAGSLFDLVALPGEGTSALQGIDPYRPEGGERQNLWSRCSAGAPPRGCDEAPPSTRASHNERLQPTRSSVDAYRGALSSGGVA